MKLRSRSSLTQILDRISPKSHCGIMFLSGMAQFHILQDAYIYIYSIYSSTLHRYEPWHVHLHLQRGNTTGTSWVGLLQQDAVAQDLQTSSSFHTPNPLGATLCIYQNEQKHVFLFSQMIANANMLYSHHAQPYLQDCGQPEKGMDCGSMAGNWAKMGSAHIMLAKHKHEPKSSAANRKIVWPKYDKSVPI